MKVDFDLNDVGQVSLTGHKKTYVSITASIIFYWLLFLGVSVYKPQVQFMQSYNQKRKQRKIILLSHTYKTQLHYSPVYL